MILFVDSSHGGEYRGARSRMSLSNMTSTDMKQLTIISTHAKLAEAVEAAKLDLSYNPQEAARSIRDTDSGYGRRDPGTEKAFVTHDGIYFIYRTSEGYATFNEFSPFCAVLHNGNYSVAIPDPENKIIHLSAPVLPKTASTRRMAAANNVILA